MKRVEELMLEFTPKLTTAARFKFNMPPQDALDLLTATYQYEVKIRQRNLILDNNTTTNLTALAEYITAAVPRFGVMCCGTCGNGKTTLMYAFQRAVNYLERIHHFSFLDDEYSRFRGSIQIFDAKEITQIARDYIKFKNLMSLPMLAIDDMGKEPAEVMEFGNILSPLVDLLEYRYNHQLFTFVTTNLIGAEIRKKYGDRIADRFNEMFHVIVFKDISYRNNDR